MKLRIGTDCSGIESPIQALKKIKNIEIDHIFSSEIDKNARLSIEANYKPKYLYEDMTKKRILEELDIYVCGFPCQPFSYCGSRNGTADKRCLFDYCVLTIKQCKPKIFILENVKGIQTVNNGLYFKKIQNVLNKLDPKYSIYINVYNTKDYGIPQNRERIFFIGLRKDIQKKEYQIPNHIKLFKTIDKYIDLKDINNLSNNKRPKFTKDNFIIPPNLHKFKGIFIDISFLKYISTESYQHYAPTLLTSGNLWCVSMNRKANIKEYLSLQGFPSNFKQVVSDNMLKKQIGNSMSVNVLYYIFKEVLSCI